jgi:hypothetical protein
MIREGTANSGTVWRLTNTTEPLIGTDDLNWVPFGSAVGELDDLTDVEIIAPAEHDTLRYIDGAWINDNRRWEPVTFNFGSGPELVWDGDDLVMEWKEY